MSKDEKDILEEIFVTRYFIIERDDKETINENIKIARELLQNFQKQVDEFAGQIANGEMVDSSECILAIQNMILADKYCKKFESQKQW